MRIYLLKRRPRRRRPSQKTKWPPLQNIDKARLANNSWPNLIRYAEKVVTKIMATVLPSIR